MLNDSGLCPGFKFVSHPHKNDQADPSNQSIDGAMYRSEHAPEVPEGASYARINWSRLEIGLECKADWIAEDGFDSNAPNDEATGDKRQAGLGQALSYTELVFVYQQRTCYYKIFFFGDYARIARFDRSSIFVTTKFNYKEEPEKLADFLWAYAHQPSDSWCGHDETATRIEPNTRLWHVMMEKKIKKTDPAPANFAHQLFSDSLDEKWPWWQLEVDVEWESTRRLRSGNNLRKFLVAKPHFRAPGVAGRGTRGYVALPLDVHGHPEDTFVYLKDAWRVDHNGIEKEGAILEELNKKNIRYVPTLVCHADVPGQVTDWRSLWKEYHPEEKSCPLKRHQHYRLVVKEVGKPLDQFESSSVYLLYALYCCLYGESSAYRLLAS